MSVGRCICVGGVWVFFGGGGGGGSFFLRFAIEGEANGGLARLYWREVSRVGMKILVHKADSCARIYPEDSPWELRGLSGGVTVLLVP